MSRSRIGILAILVLAPILFLMGVGSYHLWDRGWLFIAWWPMVGSLGLAYFLAARWARGRKILPPTDTPLPNYWTDRDDTAWQKVADKAKAYDRVTPELLSDAEHYSTLALDLARQVAEVYNPGGADPFEHLTLPEVLACIELASADLDELVQTYIPGVHMLRIRDFKRARQAVDLYTSGRNVYWAGAAIFDPVQTGIRFLASRVALGTMMERLQDNVLLWFHTAFVHHLGRYLIELNSGRLKVGVKRYRELLAAHQAPPLPTEAAPPAAEPEAAAAEVKPLSVAILGPVKAGKSSLVNALLGHQAAPVDALPVEHIGIRYRTTLAEGQELALLDTSGYGQDGPNEAEFNAAVEAARNADLIVLVTPATNPGRAPDILLLDRLKAWFAERPELRLPPLLVAVNQVDLLSPRAEWAPPYDWKTGTRAKEANIRACVAVVREQIGPRAVDVVPVCARQGEEFGIVDGLIPAMAAQLDSARGAAVLKAFHAEGAVDQFKRLGSQVIQGGKQALKILMQNWKK